VQPDTPRRKALTELTLILQKPSIFVNMLSFSFSHLPTLPDPGSDLNTGFRAINDFQDYLKNCDKVKWLEMERFCRMDVLRKLQLLHARSILLEEEVWAETLTNEIGNLFHLLKSWMPVYDQHENVSKKDEVALAKLELNLRKNTNLAIAGGRDNEYPWSPSVQSTHFSASIAMRSSVPPIASTQPTPNGHNNSFTSVDPTQFQTMDTATRSDASAMAATLVNDDDVIIADSACTPATSTAMFNFGFSNQTQCHYDPLFIADKSEPGSYRSDYVNTSATEIGLLNEQQVETQFSKPGIVSQPSEKTLKPQTSLPEGIPRIAYPDGTTPTNPIFAGYNLGQKDGGLYKSLSLSGSGTDIEWAKKRTAQGGGERFGTPGGTTIFPAEANSSSPLRSGYMEKLAGKTPRSLSRGNIPPGSLSKLSAAGRVTPSGSQTAQKRKSDNSEEPASAKRRITSKPQAPTTLIPGTSTEVENDVDLGDKRQLKSPLVAALATRSKPLR